jgi:putative hydrolases of HD superfamily
METKYIHTSELLGADTKSDIHPILELYFEYAQLKNLYRQGWLKRTKFLGFISWKRKVPKRIAESVADHCSGTSMLGYTIAEEYRPDLNSLHVMRLGLFHEIGEIIAGDITPSDNIPDKKKFDMEYAAVRKVFSKMPNSQKYVNLWLEYEHEQTPEAKFVKQIDRLEMVLQALVYEKLGCRNLDEFFPYVKERINSPELKTILEDVMRIR